MHGSIRFMELHSSSFFAPPSIPTVKTVKEKFSGDILPSLFIAFNGRSVTDIMRQEIDIDWVLLIPFFSHSGLQIAC